MKSQYFIPTPILHSVVCFIGDCDAYLFRGNGLLRCLVQLLNSLLVVSQILLAADEDDGQALAEVQDLGNPLCRISDARAPCYRGQRTFS